jgi:hypothetical protein
MEMGAPPHKPRKMHRIKKMDLKNSGTNALGCNSVPRAESKGWAETALSNFFGTARPHHGKNEFNNEMKEKPDGDHNAGRVW